MTQDEIIEMARRAGWSFMETGLDKQRLEAFAKLVEERTAAKEREACAKVCGEYNFGQAPKMIQDAIRARSGDTK